MESRRIRKVIGVGAVSALLIGTAGVLLAIKPPAVPQEVTYSDEALGSLPRRDNSEVDTSHLALNLHPPTNRWYTGLALQAKPQPVFPLPLKFAPNDTSFMFDLPKVAVSGKLIQATDNMPVTITPEGAHHYKVTRYDEASVDLAYYTEDDSNPLLTVTLTAGSPYIFVTSQQNVSFAVTAQGADPVRRDETIVYEGPSTYIGAAVYGGAEIVSSEGLAKINTRAGSMVALLASTSAKDWARLIGNAENRVTGTAVAFKREAEEYVTSISYSTANGKPTFYARLPHHGNSADGPKYKTIYGEVALSEGNKLDYRTKTVPLKPQLDLNGLSSESKDLLLTTLRRDTSNMAAYPVDTYFGGKALYHDAQLLLIAKQLGEDTTADKLQERLRSELVEWLATDGSTEKAFYYDLRAHGVVGVKPSFGSDMFNDHHFHYGYFIYAASVLAQYNEGFKEEYRDKVDLLIADIANSKTDANFPANRMYDAFFGHSWAAGFSPFADGNNQESSSEAVNAWIGMALWAVQTDNAAMQDRAAWLLSNEVAATDMYWMNYQTEAYPYRDGYEKSVVVLNWGGKRDYATFFSASPKAMLGIQLLPLSPTSEWYLSRYGGRIAEQLREARNGQAEGQQFDDYLLMYEALQGNGESLLGRAQSLPDSAIDGANSRTYMYAWLLSK